MAVISSGSFRVGQEEDSVKKGKLVRVELQPGRFVKMYESEAIERGLIERPAAKKKAPAGNKLRRPGEDKGGSSSPQPPAPPSPPPKEKSEGDDLTVIEGIGPATARALQARGISTFEALRKAERLDFLGGQAQAAIERWKEDNG